MKFSSALKIGAVVAGGAALLALGALSLRSLLSEEPEPEPEPHHEVLTGVRRSNNESNSSPEIKIMSYNVWSREDVEVEERMEAISNLVQEHSPDIIFFQEITPKIYELFQRSRWWQLYNPSVSPEEAKKGKYFCMLLSKLRVRKFIYKRFEKSSKGKGLVRAKIDIGLSKTLIVATSHLKSQNPPRTYNSKKRVSQAKKTLGILKKFPNVIFGGDMNWDEDIDGAFPLQRMWKDAWVELRGEEHGWTFDTKSNAMLRGNSPLQKRLDRFICKLEDYTMKNVEIIGKKPIPGISYYNKKRKQLPVLPSDHYGLILTVSDAEKAKDKEPNGKERVRRSQRTGKVSIASKKYQDFLMI